MPPLPPGGPFSPPPQKCKIINLHIVQFLWNLKHNIFICLPIIVETKIYGKGPPYPPGASPLKIVKFFIYDAILLKFETEHSHVFTNNQYSASD